MAKTTPRPVTMPYPTPCGRAGGMAVDIFAVTDECLVIVEVSRASRKTAQRLQER